jgi:hypothetical protein
MRCPAQLRRGLQSITRPFSGLCAMWMTITSKPNTEPMNPKHLNRYKTPFGGVGNKSGQGAFDYSKPRMIAPNPKGRIKRSVWEIPAAQFEVKPVESSRKVGPRFGGNKAAGYGNRTHSGNIWTPNSLGRIKRSVWKINTQHYSGAHFAVMPEKLIETPIRAGCPPGGIILDCFMGSGTSALTALKNGRKFIGVELNKDYCKIAENRIRPYLAQTLISDYSDVERKSSFMAESLDCSEVDSDEETSDCAERIAAEEVHDGVQTDTTEKLSKLQAKITDMEGEITNLHLMFTRLRTRMNRGGDPRYNCKSQTEGSDHDWRLGSLRDIAWLNVHYK